jgi:hypothetical protein
LQLFPDQWERPPVHSIISPLKPEERKMPVAMLGAAAIHAIIVIAGASLYLGHLH